MLRPSGTVTFLFTDIEGSTRRWEADPDAMRAALAAHDEVLRTVIAAHGGWLFKHTGDGVCAAFGSPRAAINAAVDAQRRLTLPVRIGVATGEVEERGDDYFGPALNRASRIMAAGHGGQVLVAAATAALTSGVGLLDLGDRRLRDLSGSERLYQVTAEGLRREFPPLRTLDVVPRNLPTLSTSFVGRRVEARDLLTMIRAHRLVTLTGVGGVGKTRLALHVASQLIGDLPDGAWLVELAPVGEAAVVADVVASALGVTPEAGMPVMESVAHALSGRRLLVVLDNCEHVRDAAADVVETIMARTSSVRVLATSREGLGVQSEQLWPVPPLGVGADSDAVDLFMERARSGNPGFGLHSEDDEVAVRQICARLDGIALAIEMAAARMVAMSAQDVRDRLGDRFRLLTGGRRGLARHQTLRQAVAWSYELLEVDERLVLERCAVFADGFDLTAATCICADAGLDEYRVAEVVESLVRKSLVTTHLVGGHVRYGMLETIRQFVEQQPAATAMVDHVRTAHAEYFAERAQAFWNLSQGSGHRLAMEWLDAEFANLRTAFRWATDRGDLAAATAIASHSALLGFGLQRFEPVSWAEEILAAATAADVRQLPRLYTAASLCAYIGSVKAGAEYAHIAVRLEADPRYDPFEIGWSAALEATAHFFSGRLERWREVCNDLIDQTGFTRLAGLCAMTWALPTAGDADSTAMAEETLTIARKNGKPFWVAWALFGYGRVFNEIKPLQALAALREGTAFARSHHLVAWVARFARQTASLEASHGDTAEAIRLFDTALDSFHRAGERNNAAITLAAIAVFFDRRSRLETAATLLGALTNYGGPLRIEPVDGFPGLAPHVERTLGKAAFDRSLATGAAMEMADAVRYARDQLQQAREQLSTERDANRSEPAVMALPTDPAADRRPPERRAPDGADQ